MHVQSDTKSERLSLRLDRATKRKLEQAAAAAQRSVSSFIIASALEKAEDILQTHETMVLSERDRDLFFKAIGKPPRFNVALKKALVLHSRMMEQHGQ